jgi:flagellar biogenesis protein FliO
VTGSALLATTVLALLAGGSLLLRRRLSRLPSMRALEIADRTHLSREAGIALVRARGEILLVGWGRDGVRLVARLGREGTP